MENTIPSKMTNICIVKVIYMYQLAIMQHLSFYDLVKFLINVTTDTNNTFTDL